MSTSIELPQPSPVKRRHDLDSLRAVAMLLGIVLHAALAFSPIPWTVKDSQQGEFYYVLFAAIHGFRMPLFFLLSGFFTAMLWRKRGLGGLIQQRLKRILLPLVIGCFTIIPVMWAVSIFVSQAPTDSLETKYFDAAVAGDVETVRSAIESKKIAIDMLHPSSGASMLTSAAFCGETEMVKMLLQQGAEVNQRNSDSGTALHAAIFMGSVEAAKLLLDAGADPEAKDANGVTPKDNLKVDFGTTNYIAQMYGLTVDEAELNTSRADIAEMLGVGDAFSADASSPGLGALYGLFFLLPAFMHLWFLSFLCWLVAGFAVYAAVATVVKVDRLPIWLFCSPISLLWLVPLTMLSQHFMESGTFGPGTSVGLLPIPSVLGYYAIFFFFGAIYWDLDDSEDILGRWWYLSLPIALLIVFPIGFDLISGTLGILPEDFAGTSKPLLANLMQALFVWLMTFGSIGMFRQLLSKESKTMRYISDSSYWLYVAHLPLVIFAQWFVKDLPIPAMLKFAGIIVVVSAFLLLTYEYLVRYTMIGSLLNGPKKRSKKT
ncbi:MAG: acyltransferase family protein [Mariniblastus sp.]